MNESYLHFSSRYILLCVRIEMERERERKGREGERDRNGLQELQLAAQKGRGEKWYVLL